MLVHFARRYVAPRLHGLLLVELPRRRHERLDSCFGGGVAGAPALERRKVWGDNRGTARPAVKPPR